MNGGSPRCLARGNNFFKALVEDFTQRLLIPKAWIKEMREELSGAVILHGPSGNCWHVRVSKTSKGTYLRGGWEAFVKDHSLTEGEFLLFTHVRAMHYNVKIFGTNACEREDAFTVHASLKSSRGDAGKITSTKKSKVIGGKANEAACHFTSKFPHFIIQIKSYCLGIHRYLAVPAAFVKKLLPQTRMMMLRNANGGKWKVQYCYNIGWPCRISVGWKSFASDNHIKVGDICVFELVEEDTFEVHIFKC